MSKPRISNPHKQTGLRSLTGTSDGNRTVLRRSAGAYNTNSERNFSNTPHMLVY